MLRVVIISHMPIPEDVVNYVENTLNSIVPTRVSVAYVDEILDIALQFLDISRGQVNAEALLEYIKTTLDTVEDFLEKHVYVIDVDAFVPRLNFVFGIAEMCGNIAIVFTPRLRQEFWRGVYEVPADPELLFRERLEKEILHELGHTLCLEHCPNRRCVMSFANSIMDVDYKRAEYCSHCAEKIRSVVVWKKI